MMIQPAEVERHTDAKRINEILNDPIVRPWVADMGEGVLDISTLVSNPHNFCLMGEHGGFVFVKLMPGLYEVHTQILSSGRGRWARAAAAAASRWMFTRTDAYEVVTRVPAGHIGARAIAQNEQMRLEFTREKAVIFRGESVDVHLMGARIQDWMTAAPGLEERGRWFHDRLHAEAERLGVTDPSHGDDPNHNRYVGACFEMVLHGQARKAVYWYNRWALMARHPTVQLASEAPPVVKFDIGYVRLIGADVEVSRDLQAA